MKVSILTLSVVLALVSLAPAQTANDLNEGVTIASNGTPDAFTFSWWGRYGRTYFIQQSDDLINWNQVPVIESGWDDVIQWGFSSTAPRSFFRLSYSDASVVDPLVADFDNDGISNQDEVFIHHTNPLLGDTDGDGIGDGSEVQQGTNPLNAASKPPFESLMLTGDGAEGERKTKQMTITLPAGDKSYLVVIAAKSEEFPQWTGEASEYDDVVDWKISPAGGTVIQGEKHVNTLHSAWQQSESEGTSYLGLTPVAIVQVETIKGNASGPTSVEIEVGAKNVSDGILPTTVAVGVTPFDIEKASLGDGQFVVNVPDILSGATGTLDLIFKKQGGGEVIARTIQNQAPGKVSIALDDILTGTTGTPVKPFDNQDAAKFDKLYARWRVGTLDLKTSDKTFDDVPLNNQTVKVAAVEVLALRKISNYFSPTWGGTWAGNSLQKGVYAAGSFPSGLANVARQTEFLNALDPQNEGLAMDGNTVIRDQIKSAQAGFNQVSYLNGSDYGYIEKPDRDQDNASSPSVQLLRTTSVAVRTNADRLRYDDAIYIPEFKVRTVDDSGGLHGNTDQIDVWRGQGDQALQTTVDNYGVQQDRTCLKIINPPSS
ncbi:MAG: hypothetical protein RL693_1594 [Verrucomicrobiota bacterium]|jgi:hypothetical protein